MDDTILKPIDRFTKLTAEKVTLISSELARSKAFTHRIRVGWADCDPALIAYTGRIPYFALESIDAWWGRHVGHDWYCLNLDRGVGTPFVHLSLDFKSPVTPRYSLDCTVRLVMLRDTSVGFWPAPGSEDTKFGVTMGPEVGHGEAEVHAGVQA